MARRLARPFLTILAALVVLPLWSTTDGGGRAVASAPAVASGRADAGHGDVVRWEHPVGEGDGLGTMDVAPPLGEVRCYGDGRSGRRVQPVYVLPAGQPDRGPSVDVTIARSAAYTDWVFDASAQETAGRRHIRWATRPDCSLDILHVPLPAGTDLGMHGVVTALRAAGLARTDRAYLLFVDADRYCGIGYQSLDIQPGPGNGANTGPHYARVDAPCWNRLDSREAHELAHNFGAVADAAPSSTKAGHCVDSGDRMCYAENGFALRRACPDSHERLFDCGSDDYYAASPAAGSYLSGSWNVANVQFLTAGGRPRSRVAGEDRYATAAALAHDAFPAGSTTAVLASGTGFADALSGAALDGPVLLTRRDALPASTRGALSALGARSVDVLGGDAAVSEVVLGQLRAMGITPRRIAGADRYATSAAVARAVGTLSATVFVASGEGYADALAAGPLSSALGAPLLLTPRGSVSASLRALVPALLGKTVYVVGGSGVVDDGVLSTLRLLGLRVERVAGGDRTGTAAALADLAVPLAGWAPAQVAIARGDAFADALAASTWAGRARRPLLLASSPDVVGAGTEAWLRTHAPQLGGGVVAVGGAGAVSDATLERAADAALA